MRRETVVYQGIEFHRYPDSPYSSYRRYYYSHSHKALHRVVYETHYGPIPSGNQIHHKDDNPDNNDWTNLVCVTLKQHSEAHAAKFREQRQEHMANIQPLTKAWHASEEGAAFHRKISLMSWEDRPLTTKTCQECGAEYQTPFPTRSRFCSRRCISRASERRRPKRVGH